MPEESIQVNLTLRKCVSGFFLFLNNCSFLFEVSSFVVIQEDMVSSCVVMCSRGVVMMATPSRSHGVVMCRNSGSHGVVMYNHV